jgi:hypothetical protein
MNNDEQQFNEKSENNNDSDIKSSLPTRPIDEEITSSSSMEKEPFKTKENSIHYIENKYEEEDSDIQVVNELATIEDDTTLPCYTLRVFITGIVSSAINYCS